MAMRSIDHGSNTEEEENCSTTNPVVTPFQLSDAVRFSNDCLTVPLIGLGCLNM